MMELFWLALNWHTVTAAVLSGTMVGYLLYGPLVDHVLESAGFSTETRRTLRQIVPVLILGSGIPVAVIFYGHQSLVEALDGQNTWPRILGRGIVFVVYIVSMAAGLWVRERRKAADG